MWCGEEIEQPLMRLTGALPFSCVLNLPSNVPHESNASLVATRWKSSSDAFYLCLKLGFEFQQLACLRGCFYLFSDEILERLRVTMFTQQVQRGSLVVVQNFRAESTRSQQVVKHRPVNNKSNLNRNEGKHSVRQSWCWCS